MYYLKLFLFFVGAFCFLSCKTQKQCHNCVIRREDYKGIILFNDTLVKLEFPDSRIWSPDDGGITEVINTRLGQKQYFLLDKLTGANNQAWLTVLYINLAILPTKKFSIDNIKAISRIYKNKYSLHHDFYEWDSTIGFIRKENMSCDIQIVTTNATTFISNNIVFPNNTINATFFIGNEGAGDYNSKGSIDLLMKKAKKYYNELTRIGKPLRNSISH